MKLFNSWELNSFAFFFSVFQTKLLTQYVLNLAKYDQNYDIRDRARFIRQLIVPTDKSGALHKYAKKLFLALKPAPSWSLHLKVKVFILVNYKNPDLHANQSTFLLLRLLGPSGKNWGAGDN